VELQGLLISKDFYPCLCVIPVVEVHHAIHHGTYVSSIRPKIAHIEGFCQSFFGGIMSEMPRTSQFSERLFDNMGWFYSTAYPKHPKEGDYQQWR
jgi:hypothetical protein